MTIREGHLCDKDVTLNYVEKHEYSNRHGLGLMIRHIKGLF